MGALTWIVRVLFLAIIVRTVLRLVRGLGARQGGSAPRRVERTGGTLVRDPNCGTYIPREGALTTGSGPSTTFFCSVACRDAHRAGRGSEARTG